MIGRYIDGTLSEKILLKKISHVICKSADGPVSPSEIP